MPKVKYAHACYKLSTKVFISLNLFQTKMKLLTFMQLAETKTEITFGEIQKHLQLGDNEVEGFLIERKISVQRGSKYSRHSVTGHFPYLNGEYSGDLNSEHLNSGNI